MLHQTDLSGVFIIPLPSKLYPFLEEIYDYNALFETNFDRQKPTLGKMYEINSDVYLNFFLHCKKYFRLKSF